MRDHAGQRRRRPQCIPDGSHRNSQAVVPAYDEPVVPRVSREEDYHRSRG